LPKLEEPFVIGSSDLTKMFDLTYWLVRRRLANECFILNRANLAAIFAKKWPMDYRKLKNALPPWIVFFNLAGYDYFPEDRIKYQQSDVLGICQKMGLVPIKNLGGISAQEILHTVQRPCTEPYWKLRSKGACQDVFFLTIYDKLAGLIHAMNDLVTKAGYPESEMGVYIQPGVQGTSCHCEFSLFYDPENNAEKTQIKEISSSAVKSLPALGAFFSRPYAENARMIVNRDATSVEALTRIKKILDPNNIMNPGKLCF
jgi:hypothetical protein